MWTSNDEFANDNFISWYWFRYADAGPTHYATEDYACLRAMIGTSILQLQI